VAALDAPLLMQAKPAPAKSWWPAPAMPSVRAQCAVPGPELRGAAGEPGRERAVRLCPRRLHRRATRRQAGADGTGQPGHGVSR
jgi:hypothetical protein